MDPIKYLNSLYKSGIKLGLSNIRHLLAGVGGPHNDYTTVHIAGTNGKGSTATFITRMLMERGLRVGKFTSPHLVDFSERITLNETPISRGDIEDCLRSLVPIAEEMKNDDELGSPTFFELSSALAFLYFSRKDAEVGVIEVGMGGRLDSTNVVLPAVSAICSVSVDHAMHLGETLSEIAVEKAGIIKQGIPVVLAPNPPEVIRIVKRTCVDKEAPLYVEGEDFRFTRGKCEFQKQTFDFVGAGKTFTGLEIGMAGEFQIENAATALMTVLVAQDAVGVIEEKEIRSGLMKARWPGRMEVVAERPHFILDGAHNPAAAQALTTTVMKHFTDRKVILIFAAVSDKDVQSVFRNLVPMVSEAILSPIDVERSMTLEELEAQCKPIFRRVRGCKSIADAIDTAYSCAEEEDVILLAGSLFAVGEAKRVLNARAGGREA